jgi:hypothetical protein
MPCGRDLRTQSDFGPGGLKEDRHWGARLLDEPMTTWHASTVGRVVLEIASE